MKKQLPETSLAANKAAVPEMRMQHHKKITDALRELKIATYEKISEYAKMERHQVGRRLNELEKMGVVYKPGLQLATKSGRMAFCYALTSTPVQTPEQFVTQVIENASKPDATQQSLF